MDHQAGRASGVGASSLTQEQRERAERNRLAALERRRQSACFSSITSGAPLQGQPTPGAAGVWQSQLSGTPQQATPAPNALRGIFMGGTAAPTPALNSHPAVPHSSSSFAASQDQQQQQPREESGWAGAGYASAGPTALRFEEAQAPTHQQRYGAAAGSNSNGPHPPRQLTTHMGWQQPGQQLGRQPGPQAGHQLGQQPDWQRAQGHPAQPSQPTSQLQQAAGKPARGFRFSEPLGLQQGSQGQPPRLPLHPMQQQQQQQSGAAWPGAAKPPPHPFAASNVNGSVGQMGTSNGWAGPAQQPPMGGNATAQPPGQARPQQHQQQEWPPQERQAQQQQPHERREEGRYGNGSTFSFTKHAGGGAPKPQKHLTQATLTGTLSKWRSSRQVPGPEQTLAEELPAASVPLGGAGQGFQGPYQHGQPGVVVAPVMAPLVHQQANPAASNAGLGQQRQQQHQWQQYQWQQPVGGAIQSGCASNEMDDLLRDFLMAEDDDDWGQPQMPSHPPQPLQQRQQPQYGAQPVLAQTAPLPPAPSSQQPLHRPQWQQQGQVQPAVFAGHQAASGGQSLTAYSQHSHHHQQQQQQQQQQWGPYQQQQGRYQEQHLGPSQPSGTGSKWAAFTSGARGLPTSAAPSAALGGCGASSAAQAGPVYGHQPTVSPLGPAAEQATSDLRESRAAAAMGFASAEVGLAMGQSHGCASGSMHPGGEGSAALPKLAVPKAGHQRDEKRRAKFQQKLGRAPEEDTEDRERWAWLKERRDAEGRAQDDPSFDPTTILIPKGQEPRRPFDRQFWSIKRKHMDLVLFVRVGSFYELYDTDADVGMRIGLNAMSGQQPANMYKVGCHHWAFQEWAARVLALGYNVGRVEELPGKNADKLVNRKLVQIYTPGTVLDGPLLDSVGGGMQPLLALFEGANGVLGACMVDVALATISLSQWQEIDSSRSMLATMLLAANPAEVVVLRGQLSADTHRMLKGHRPMCSDGTERALAVSLLHGYSLLHDPDDPEGVPSLVQHTEDMYMTHRGAAAAWAGVPDFLHNAPYAAVALQMALNHMKAAEVIHKVLPHANFQPIAAFTSDGARASGHMLLDSCAVKTLELVEDSLGTSEGSLLRFLSQAVSPAGRRKVRTWLVSPLFRVGDITERLDIVQAFMQCPAATAAFRDALHSVPDCERLLPRVADKLAGVLERAVAAVDSMEEAEQQQQGQWGSAQQQGQPQQQQQQQQGPWGRDAGPSLGANQPCGGASGGDGSKWVSSAAAGPAGGGWGNQGGDGAEEAFERAASVMDLRQVAFLPVVQLLEGLGMLLQALKQLEGGLAEERGCGLGSAALPLLRRALARGGAVALALQTLLAVFDAQRFSDPQADLSLEEGVSPAYDAAHAEIMRLQRSLQQLVEGQQRMLAAAGGSAAAVRKVKLVETGEETLLEVPKELSSSMPHNCEPVKITKTLARYRVPAIVEMLAQLERERSAARALVLDSMAEAARLFLDQYTCFLDFVSCMAALDALAGFAVATHPQAAPAGCSFCRPIFAAAAAADGSGPAPPLLLENLWNPQLVFSGVTHIEPNTLQLGGSSGPATLLLTGANTGGKSTLLRASCLAVVMAQLGCFVPCSRAELAPVDRIFTRIGAQDRLMTGESTFMVEMTETSCLLRHATPSSLVVLDELGRGTSTFDGYAIAYAVLMQLTLRNRCRTLFATHYHYLCKEPDLVPIVRQAHMATAVQQDTFVPLFQLREGPAAEGSCGIAVAATCGMPHSLIARAVERADQIKRDIAHKQALARKRKAHPTAALPHLPSQAAAAAVQRILGTLARDQSGEPGALQAAVVMARQLSAALGVL